MGAQFFSISEAMRFGWRTAKERFWFFAQAIIVIALITYGPGVIMRSFDRIELPTLVTLFFFLAGIVFWVVQLLISIGLIQITLSHVDSRKTDIAELFTGARFLMDYVLGSFLFALIVGVGLVLLVVPGLIFLARFQFYQYVIVDKGAGSVQALKESWRITAGAFWQLVLFWLAVLGANILGFAALGIGLFWSIPATMLATGWVYRRLSHRSHA
ncbi:MAG: DUF975 family protein [Parcubacteria group bacterium]|nr:DUF975 family protein [Parcubacteria group bacterium]